jgi:hypothetical protein
MTVFLFVHICLYVTYTNHSKNLVNEWLTTFLTPWHTSSWRVRTFLKQDGVSSDPETFSYVWRNVWVYTRKPPKYAHTKTTRISLQRGFLGLGGGIDGRTGPRTGTSERISLSHCVGTRRVAFGVGNAWSLFPWNDKRAWDACSWGRKHVVSHSSRTRILCKVRAIDS